MIALRSILADVLTSKDFETTSLPEMTLEPFVDMISYRHGLTFKIPKDYGNNVFQNSRGDFAILVESLNDGWRLFYPRTFLNKVWAYNKEGEPLGYFKRARGTAIECFNKHTTMGEALDSLAGKWLYVSEIEECYRQGPHGLEQCTIPVIDIQHLKLQK